MSGSVMAQWQDRVVSQLAELSVTTSKGDCLLWLDPEVSVLTEEGSRSAQQAAAWLDAGEWVDPVNTCGTVGCIRPDHVHVRVSAHQAEQDTALVQSFSSTLASLYRVARKKGLVSAGSSYN